MINFFISQFQYFRFPVCKIRRQVAIFTIVNPVNLSMMINKIDKYKSSADFFSDLQWIFHYCHAHYSGKWIISFVIKIKIVNE